MPRPGHLRRRSMLQSECDGRDELRRHRRVLPELRVQGREMRREQSRDVQFTAHVLRPARLLQRRNVHVYPTDGDPVHGLRPVPDLLVPERVVHGYRDSLHLAARVPGAARNVHGRNVQLYAAHRGLVHGLRPVPDLLVPERVVLGDGDSLQLAADVSGAARNVQRRNVQLYAAHRAHVHGQRPVPDLRVQERGVRGQPALHLAAHLLRAARHLRRRNVLVYPGRRYDAVRGRCVRDNLSGRHVPVPSDRADDLHSQRGHSHVYGRDVGPTQLRRLQRDVFAPGGRRPAVLRVGGLRAVAARTGAHAPLQRFAVEPSRRPRTGLLRTSDVRPLPGGVRGRAVGPCAA
jgi:hypothetical protein